MRRRAFIAMLGGAAAWPLPVRAQQAAMPVIGFLNAASPDGYVERLRGFRQGLKEEGLVEGENLAVEYRWAENQISRVAAMASELVRQTCRPPSSWASRCHPRCSPLPTR
jgi:putative tryptophan/tyrosine transport system substrate-binding protein